MKIVHIFHEGYHRRRADIYYHHLIHNHYNYHYYYHYRILKYNDFSKQCRFEGHVRDNNALEGG